MRMSGVWLACLYWATVRRHVFTPCLAAPFDGAAGLPLRGSALPAFLSVFFSDEKTQKKKATAKKDP